MLRSTLITLLVTATAAYAQFPLQIVSPTDQEYLQLGQTVPVTIQAQNVTNGTHHGAPIQIAICQIVTGLPPCNNTEGTVLLTHKFRPPVQAYNVTIPASQPPGLTRFIVRHVSHTNGTTAYTDETFIDVYLGDAA